MSLYFLFFFFFFQAEDGIRDADVMEFRRVLFRSEPAEENDAGQVEDRREPEIEVAVKELHARWHQVVELDGHGAQEEDDEAPIDGGVHDPGAPVPHDGAHRQAVDQAADPLAPLPDPTVGLPLLPDFRPPGEQEEHQPHERRDDDIEDHHDGVGDVAEDLACDLEVRVLLETPDHPEHRGAHRTEDPYPTQHPGRGDPLRRRRLLPLFRDGHRRASVGGPPATAGPPRAGPRGPARSSATRPPAAPDLPAWCTTWPPGWRGPRRSAA